MLPYQLELPFERVSDYQGNWIVEASTAGLVAGEWPNTIHVSGPAQYCSGNTAPPRCGQRTTCPATCP